MISAMAMPGRTHPHRLLLLLFRRRRSRIKRRSTIASPVSVGNASCGFFSSSSSIQGGDGIAFAVGIQRCENGGGD